MSAHVKAWVVFIVSIALVITVKLVVPEDKPHEWLQWDFSSSELKPEKIIPVACQAGSEPRTHYAGYNVQRVCSENNWDRKKTRQAPNGNTQLQRVFVKGHPKIKPMIRHAYNKARNNHRDWNPFPEWWDFMKQDVSCGMLFFPGLGGPASVRCALAQHSHGDRILAKTDRIGFRCGATAIVGFAFARVAGAPMLSRTWWAGGGGAATGCAIDRYSDQWWRQIKRILGSKEMPA